MTLQRPGKGVKGHVTDPPPTEESRSGTEDSEAEAVL